MIPKKLERPDPICRRDRHALTVHLNRTLPLLEIQPWAGQETDDDRNRKAPVVEVGFGNTRCRERAGAFLRSGDDDEHDRHQPEQREHTVAVFDALDVELLTKKNRRRQHDQQREREVKLPGFESKRLPPVSHEGKNRQRDRQHLIQEKMSRNGLDQLVKKRASDSDPFSLRAR